MINIDSRLLNDIDGNELYLLAHLTNRINKDRYCFPGNSTLCKDLKWSKEKLQKIKKALVTKGLIQIETRYKENNPGQTSNIYRILTPQVGNYTPGLENSMGGVVKSPPPHTENRPTPDLEISPTPVGKSGNEVLTNEVLINKELTNEELEKEREEKILSHAIYIIFKELIDVFYPDFKDYKFYAFDDLRSDEKISDPVTERLLKKLLVAAREIHSCFENLKRPLPEWRAKGRMFSKAGEINPASEASDQIQAYYDYCRLTKTYITTDPEKLPEKLIQADWCEKLFKYAEDNQEKYDAGCDPDILSQWLVEIHYNVVIAYVDRRYNNRIVFGCDEYLSI